MAARWLTKDLLTGVLFMALGALGLLLGAGLPMGTADAMEAGYYPRLVSGITVALGGLLAVTALLKPGEAPERWHWWPVLLVTAAAVAFALMLDALGFVATLFGVALLASAAGWMLNVWRSLVLAAVLTAMNVGLFVFALGMPLRLWPRL